MKKLYPLLLLTLPNLLLHSQQQPISPGGVPGVILWMQAVQHTEDRYGLYKWKDYSGDSLRVRYYDERGAAYGEEYLVKADYYLRNYSFSPALSLNWSDRREASKEILIKGGNLSTATIVGAYSLRADPMDAAKNILTLNGVSGKGFIFGTDKIINSKESQRGSFDYGSDEGYDFMYHSGKSPEASLNKFKERALRSFVYYRTNKPTRGVWGERREAVISLGQKYYSTNVNNTSTYDVQGGDGDYGESYLPELFIYNRLLTPLERIQAESYLAIKYGFTLERSYLNSSGNLVWDLGQHKPYNTRITGIMRDDKSGLYQKGGTTSYEEGPIYSYSAEGDSYEDENSSANGNRYGLPNGNKLLSIERLSADCSMKDQDYTLWGDNDKGLDTREDSRYLGLKIMKRQWQVGTNMGGKQAAPEQLKWKIDNLETQPKGYKINISKSAGNTAAIGSLVSANPLPGGNGQLYLEVGQGIGPAIIKFGTPSAQEVNNSHDYGIYINEKGVIYPIIKGYPQWNAAWYPTANVGTQLRLTKTKESLLISYNGWALPQTGQALPQILIDKQDQDKSYYASVGIYRANKDIKIDNIRAEGFVDTGNRIELSYVKGRAEEFTNYSGPTPPQTYLLVDRSGQGDFKQSNTDIIPMDEQDPYRSKIIFNNIFFDTDHNGQDAFTFAYRPSNLIAKLEKQQPSCNAQGESQKDGKLSLTIERGDAGYQYQLYNTENNQIEKEGIFFNKTYDITGLSAGSYKLKLKELGGFNLVPDPQNSAEPHGNSQFYVNQSTTGGFLDTYYRYTDQSFQMGFTPSVPGLPDIYVREGIEVDQGQLYKINNKIRQTVPLTTAPLKEGDLIQIQNSSPGLVEYKLNGKTLASDRYTGKDMHFYMFKLNNTQRGVYNIKHHKNDWWHQQNLKREDLSETAIESVVKLESGCKGSTTPISDDPVVEAQANNALVLYYKDFSNKSAITARIHVKEPSGLTLAVFDFSGNQLYSKTVTENKTDHIIELNMLPKGVYIVKVFTNEGEHTKKITIN